MDENMTECHDESRNGIQMVELRIGGWNVGEIVDYRYDPEQHRVERFDEVSGVSHVHVQ